MCFFPHSCQRHTAISPNSDISSCHMIVGETIRNTFYTARTHDNNRKRASIREASAIGGFSRQNEMTSQNTVYLPTTNSSLSSSFLPLLLSEPVALFADLPLLPLFTDAKSPCNATRKQQISVTITGTR